MSIGIPTYNRADRYLKDVLPKRVIDRTDQELSESPNVYRPFGYVYLALQLLYAKLGRQAIRRLGRLVKSGLGPA